MASEINYLAFGIASIDYHIALYGRLQSVTQKHRIVECDAFISQHPNYNATLHEKLTALNMVVLGRYLHIFVMQ